MTHKGIEEHDRLLRWDHSNAPLHRAEFSSELEIRQGEDGGEYLSGSFPYNETATIRDRGRVRKERFGSRAFHWQIEAFEQVQRDLADAITRAQEDAIRELRLKLARRNIDLLSGHQYGQPIANVTNGTLRLTDGSDALRFRAALPPPDVRPRWIDDAIRGVRTGLIRGVSPGFKIPPRNVVAGAITLLPERVGSNVFVRSIKSAVLYELSLVTRAAYAGSIVAIESAIRAAIPAAVGQATRYIARELGARLATRIGGRVGDAIGATYTSAVLGGASAAAAQLGRRGILAGAGSEAAKTATTAAIEAAALAAGERVSAALGGQRLAGQAAAIVATAVRSTLNAFVAGGIKGVRDGRKKLPERPEPGGGPQPSPQRDPDELFDDPPDDYKLDPDDEKWLDDELDDLFDAWKDGGGERRSAAASLERRAAVWL